MDKLKQIQSALDELAAEYSEQVERNYARNHLTQQDHEMIRRGFAKYDATRNLSLREQAILVKREVKTDAPEVLGLWVSNDVARSRAQPKRRKKHTVLPPEPTDQLSELHSHLRSLRNNRQRDNGVQ